MVGGGIAGLAGARAAVQAAQEAGIELHVTVLESDDRLGGKIRTEMTAGPPREWGPDAFLATKPWALALARSLGMDTELIEPNPQTAGTYLLVGGRLRRLPGGLAMGIPAGIRPLFLSVSNGVISPAGALRAALEPLVGHRSGGDPTVGEFMRRRLGGQVASRMIAPLVSGVYGAPVDELSMQATLPQFATGKSLMISMARRPPASGPAFVSFRGGMGRLVERLADDLGPERIRTNCRVDAVSRAGGGFLVQTESGSERCDAVLVAAPAPASAPLLRSVASETSALLETVRYRSSVVVHLSYPSLDPRTPRDAWGYLVPPGEGGVVAAGSFYTSKWPHPGEEGMRLRVVVNDREAVRLPDDSLVGRVVEEVERATGAGGGAEVTVRRWEHAMPVYAPGHRDRVGRATAALPPGVALAGATLSGVGVPDCVHTGEEAGRRLVGFLASPAPAGTGP